MFFLRVQNCNIIGITTTAYTFSRFQARMFPLKYVSALLNPWSNRGVSPCRPSRFMNQSATFSSTEKHKYTAAKGRLKYVMARLAIQEGTHLPRLALAPGFIYHAEERFFGATQGARLFQDTECGLRVDFWEIPPRRSAGAV